MRKRINARAYIICLLAFTLASTGGGRRRRRRRRLSGHRLDCRSRQFDLNHGMERNCEWKQTDK